MTAAIRRSVVGFPVAATAALGALGAQAWYAGHRRLPRYGDLDPGGVFGPADAPEVRIALLGDSTVSGTGLADPASLWLRQAIDPLTDRFRIRLRSEAVSGARARDVLMYQVRGALAWGPDLAIVSVGANDALRRPRLAGFEAELRRIVRRLREAGPTVVLAGVGDIGSAPLLPFPLRMVASHRSRIADRIHARVAAGEEGVLKVPAAETAATFRSRPDLFCADRFHPNRAGHRIWADAAVPVLARAVAAVRP